MHEQDTPKYSDKAGRTPAILAGVLLVAGAFVSWFGLKGGTLIDQQSDVKSAESSKDFQPIKLPADEAAKQALLTAGKSISQTKCSGCHDVDSKMTGPSYTSIAQRFSSQTQNKSELPPSFIMALEHKAKNWNGYENAQPRSLTNEEKLAVGYWILHTFANTQSAITQGDVKARSKQ